MINKLFELCNTLGCTLKTDCSLKEYTTLKIGGVCSFLIEVNSVNSVTSLLKFINTHNIKYDVLGRGSNIIASDEGFDGVILHFGKSISEISVYDVEDDYSKRNYCITAEAGALLSNVCIKAQECGLSGIENLYGIPGTVGGALYMNSGAYGIEMKDVVVFAEYIDEYGSIRIIHNFDMDLSYRHSIFSNKKFIITSVTFKFKKYGHPKSIKKSMEEYMQSRVLQQPLEYPSAGSMFKHPHGNYASFFIEKCGLKGMTVGGAMISQKHSGFIINIGNASCADIMKLCEKVKLVVREKTGYDLELEPVFLK